VQFNKVKQIADLDIYIQQGSIPGGTVRNWDSYGLFINLMDETQKAILCDPQTSGGLLIAVKPGARKEVEELLTKEGLSEYIEPIGELRENTGGTLINVE
ncbi:MAG TPA: selenide, water dikinase SelD, partial [Bacteroidia bacterium]|nr:selenide, water dikinase SelD [Bacteroidia bacterium]